MADKIVYQQDGIIIYEQSPGFLYWQGGSSQYRSIKFIPGDQEVFETHLRIIINSVKKVLDGNT
jgi:hypothetical protein